MFFAIHSPSLHSSISGWSLKRCEHASFGVIVNCDSGTTKNNVCMHQSSREWNFTFVVVAVVITIIICFRCRYSFSIFAPALFPEYRIPTPRFFLRFFPSNRQKVESFFFFRFNTQTHTHTMIPAARDGAFNAEIITFYCLARSLWLIEIRTSNSDNRKTVATNKTIPIETCNGNRYK